MFDQPQAGAGNEHRVEIGRTRDPSDCAVDRGGGYAGGDVIVFLVKGAKDRYLVTALDRKSVV